MINPYPRITVIIPTFNRADYLKECLSSIFSQTLPADQIIVVNDGSTDHTNKICQLYAHKIEYYELDQMGKPGAINFGLKKTIGDYIWIFDDDDVAFKDALERLVEPLRNNPNLDFSYSPFFYTATNIKNNKIGDVISQSKIPDLDQGFLVALLERNFLGGAALFAKTSCYQIVGDFDLDLLRSQDYEMAIRIARRFNGARVSRPTFHYRQHEGMRGPNLDRFKSIQNKEKWLKYDQHIFRKLYRTLPLSDYLSPGCILDDNIRQAILQRMLVMASKGLFLELTQDLQLLASLTDQTPFSKNEYTIVRAMITNKLYYNNESLFEYAPFFKEVRRLAKSSDVIRLLRFNLICAIGARVKNQPRLNEIHKSLNRLAYLNFI